MTERATKGHTDDTDQEDGSIDTRLWLQIGFAPARLFRLQRVQPYLSMHTTESGKVRMLMSCVVVLGCVHSVIDVRCP